MTHEEMRERTRLSFADALKGLMEEKPLDKITVKDLITRCNVNRKTFNYYFTDVYDLLQWILDRDYERDPPRLRTGGAAERADSRILLMGCLKNENTTFFPGNKRNQIKY